MSFMNIEALSNSIDFNVNSVYDVLVYFVDVASDCLIETRFVDCIDAYGLSDVLDDGVFYVPGAMCLGYRIARYDYVEIERCLSKKGRRCRKYVISVDNGD